MKDLLGFHLSLPKRVSTHLSIAGMRFKFYFPLFLILAAGAAVTAPGWFLSPSGAQSGRARLQQDIEQVFLSHEEVQLDTRAAARRVQGSGRLSLVTPRHNFEIRLSPHDVRASNYRAEEDIYGGIKREVPMPAISTYRGNVEGMAGAEARFTVNENRLEGMIITSEGSYFLESARNYSSAAGPNDYLLYEASEVRPEVARVCGTLEDQISRSVKDVAPKLAAGTITPDAFSPLKVVEIATEADGEFTAALGSSAAANSEILSIMNQVQAIYQRDIGLTFKVVFQHTWTDAGSDPYTAGGDAVAVINEFTSVWNRDFAGTPRDLAHLWTARDLGGPAGIAWMGVVCLDGSHSYGLSQRETMSPFRVGIPAHEIGHNFNASHADGQAACDNTIMAAIQNPANSLTLCPFSVNEITAYVNGHSSCLSNAPAGNPIDQADFFVRQHYLDFLNRPADPAGLAFWTGQITACGANPQCIDANRVNVSGAFFLSIEFQQTGYLVERLYKTAYGDATGTSTFGPIHQLSVPIVRLNEFVPDMTTIGQGVVVGQAGWEQLLENNKQAFVAQFVARSRFTTAYPAGLAPAVFVQTLNNRAGDPLPAGELAVLIAEHTAGAKSRAQVLRQIAEHQNLVNAERNKAFVLMQYFGYLQRNPNSGPDSDHTGYDFWLTKLNQFGGNFTNAEMVKAFLTSIEYRQRFGPP
jgi:hypothetical protein